LTSCTHSGGLLGNYTALVDRNRVRWHDLAPYIETPVAATLRYSLAYAQMHWVNTKSMQFNARRTIQGSGGRARCMRRPDSQVGPGVSGGIRALENAHCRAVRRTARPLAIAGCSTRAPSVLFCSPAAAGHRSVVLAARRAGVPTATFIFSWDNLSSKGRIAAPSITTWCGATPCATSCSVTPTSTRTACVVGTRSSTLRRQGGLTRDAFFKQIGADPARPLICYSA
jgi:hypothetical protein